MRIVGSDSGQHHLFLLSILSILTLCIAANLAWGRQGKGKGLSTNRLSISSAGPNSGPAAGGTTVTLSGSGFTPSASVSFGGIAAPSVVVVSSTELQAVTPTHASGTVSVAVTENPHNQSATLAGGFTYTSSSPTTLSVSGASPATGPTSGGTAVTITGKGFQAGATVRFGASQCAAVTVASSTQITAMSPSGSSGTVSITVTDPDSQSASLASGFTYTSPTTLSVSGASPATGPTSGGTAVTITGKGFQAGATVRFGASQSTAVTVASSTQINATSPAGSAGIVSITVTDPDSQSASLPSGFTYTSPTTLSVSGASPATGPTSGGTVVTITGKGFQTAAAVKFGGSQSTAVTVASSTQINAMSPPGSSGTVSITVTNPDTQSASLPSGFTYNSEPAVSSISPNSGPVTGGTTVRILGSGFQSGANVTFGGIAATSVTLVSATEIQAVSPVSPAGTVSIAVNNTDSQSASLASAFTYFHTVTLSWTNSSSGASGFNVYRSSTSGGPYSRLNSTLLSGTSFSDAHVQAGQTYFYVTTAVNDSNAESGYSNQAHTIVPSP